MKSLPLTLIVCFFLTHPFANAQDKDKAAAEKEALFAQANKAGAVLRDFFDAKTWEEASKFVLNAKALAPVMKAHYAQFEWMNREVLAVRGTGATKVPGKVVYHVIRADLVVKGMDDYVRVSLVEVGDAYKVDWEPFAQAYDRSFEKFQEQKPGEAHFFRMGLYRGAILPEHAKLPLEGEMVRVIGDWRPNTEERASLFTTKSSPLGKAVVESVPYDDFIACRVKVKWNKSGAEPFLELMGLETIDISTPSVVSGPLKAE